MSHHDIRVVALLTGDEYWLLKTMGEEDGMSQSCLIRGLIKAEARRRAVAEVSAERPANDSAVSAQDMHK